MLGETIHFFSDVNPLNFFFGTVWDPRFAAAGADDSRASSASSRCCAGTLYIALVSMLVAVPVGLMAAVYMGEYASPQRPLDGEAAARTARRYPHHRLRHLRRGDARARSCAISRRRWRGGFAFIQAQSVFTAGLVMGVMLIPVVSSLSDDVITAGAPRHARRLAGARRHPVRDHPEGDPARRASRASSALSCSTASRAIGETMIVVLAAGVAGPPRHQPVRGDDHHHRQDRQPADRRPRVRLAADAGAPSPSASRSSS